MENGIVFQIILIINFLSSIVVKYHSYCSSSLLKEAWLATPLLVYSLRCSLITDMCQMSALLFLLGFPQQENTYSVFTIQAFSKAILWLACPRHTENSEKQINICCCCCWFVCVCVHGVVVLFSKLLHKQF